MKYDRIEIHFRTRKNEPRMVIIDRDTDVTAIRLEKPKNPEDPEDTSPPTKLPQARGLHIVGTVALTDGPDVCYDTPDGLICW